MKITLLSNLQTISLSTIVLNNRDQQENEINVPKTILEHVLPKQVDVLPSKNQAL